MNMATQARSLKDLARKTVSLGHGGQSDDEPLGQMGQRDRYEHGHTGQKSRECSEKWGMSFNRL